MEDKSYANTLVSFNVQVVCTIQNKFLLKPWWLYWNGIKYSLHSEDLYKPLICRKGFSDGSVVKNLPADPGDAGSIPGSGRSPGEGNGNHSHILAWEIPWTGKPVGYSPWGLKTVRPDLATKTTTIGTKYYARHWWVCVLSCFSRDQLFMTPWTGGWGRDK